MHRCPNCYKSLTDEFSYCPHCSQQQHLPQLSLKHIFADFFDTLFNLERGFLLTFRMLLFKPSVMFRRYFSGQRVRYSSPMRFFILAVLLSLLTSFAFHPKWNFMEQRPKNTTEWTDSIVINLGKDADQITKSKALKQWMNDYLKPILEFSEKNSLYIQIVNLFLVAGIVHLIVRKKKRYNY
ncbi:MAG: DUF3667 domain-containing protein, partial [Cytophagales bacterium]|nr:DUF3667 domain-containing protein [Cytophagales bacterium]